MIYQVLENLFLGYELPNLWAVVPLAIGLSWSMWWCWTFKIYPWIKPFDAPIYPYYIPIFGHSYLYYENSHKLIANARRYFNNTDKPFAIVLAGKTHYVLTSPADAHAMYSKPSIFGFDSFLGKALNGFGVKESSLNAFWGERQHTESNKSGKCLVHLTEEIHKKHLLPGPRLNALVKTHQTALDESMTFDHLTYGYGLATATKTDPIPLFDLVTKIMIDSMQTCLFDPILRSIDPGMTGDMMNFTNELWMLMNPTAMVDDKTPKRILKRYQDAMKEYQRLPASSRPNESSLIADLVSTYESYDIDNDDRAAVLVMVYWAVTSNVSKLPYWILANILPNEQLCAELRAEVSLAFQGEEIDTNYLIKECPLLKSVYLEALRLSKTDHSYRTVDRNIEINGVLLRQGTNAILSISELHRDESVFGSKASDFNPTRFLEQPKLASSRSFKPYGGGTTLCPGRDFALRQTMYFMALWLHKYDARVVGSLSKPQLDEEWMAIGLCRPLAGTDYAVELSIRDSAK